MSPACAKEVSRKWREAQDQIVKAQRAHRLEELEEDLEEAADDEIPAPPRQRRRIEVVQVVAPQGQAVNPPPEIQAPRDQDHLARQQREEQMLALLPVVPAPTLNLREIAPEEGYIVVRNYTDDQAGQAIREQDVIRAENGLFYADDEVRRFQERSLMRCPTYGTCPHCWGAGPVNQLCGECEPINTGFMVLYAGYNSTRILDSERVATVLRRAKTIARADCRAQSTVNMHFYRSEEQMKAQIRETLRPVSTNQAAKEVLTAKMMREIHELYTSQA